MNKEQINRKKHNKVVATYIKYSHIKTYKDLWDNELKEGYYMLHYILKNLDEESDYTTMTIYEDAARWLKRQGFTVKEVHNKFTDKLEQKTYLISIDIEEE